MIYKPCLLRQDKNALVFVRVGFLGRYLVSVLQEVTAEEKFRRKMILRIIA